MLKDALLETVPLPLESSATGKLIRELQLRSRTGASIVGIERNGESVINPSPDDELLAGDRILLLGTESQLAAARTALAGPTPVA
jgi:CPA2 family monovalent cation:H+ antiporter-2